MEKLMPIRPVYTQLHGRPSHNHDFLYSNALEVWVLSNKAVSVSQKEHTTH